MLAIQDSMGRQLPHQTSQSQSNNLDLRSLQNLLLNNLNPTVSQASLSTNNVANLANNAVQRQLLGQLTNQNLLDLGLLTGLPGLGLGTSNLLSSLGSRTPIGIGAGLAESLVHPLYSHGSCQWPQCNTQCESLATFLHHLNQSHAADETSMGQLKLQMGLVEGLEGRINEERGKLQSMMTHLQMKHSPDSTQPHLGQSTATTAKAQSAAQSPVLSPKTTQFSLLDMAETVSEYSKINFF